MTAYLKRLAFALDLAIGEVLDASYRALTAPVTALHPED